MSRDRLYSRSTFAPYKVMYGRREEYLGSTCGAEVEGFMVASMGLKVNS